ncbi:MAG: peptidoglycan-binding protein [Archangiaceae bacterium]|nr:peptidoglycan-binding protein [Archangiaceae bacterium]
MKEEGPMRIQKKLADAGYYKGEVTGELDAATTTALEKFQRDNELAGTGAPDRDTLKALGLDPDDIWRNQQKREKEELKERREKHEEKEKEETPRS